jgi:hypothetical protein
MHHDNDNQPRTPEQHRAYVAQQNTSGERAYQSGSWPQGQRLFKAGNTRLLGGLAGWQIMNQMPRLAAANDNFAKDTPVESSIRDDVDADTIVAAVEAEKLEPGKHYREETQEVYVVIKRDKDGEPIRGEWRPIAGETFTNRHHSAAAPDWSVDDAPEEEKVAAIIDCKRTRARLGPAVCNLLDMAAGNATTTEIAEAIGVSRAKAEKYVDAVVEKYLQVAA